MALGRWKFSSSRNKSSTSSGDQSSNGTTTPTDNEGQDMSKTSSRLRRTLTTFRAHKSKKSGERDEYAHLNKPFTKQNLEHQKVLNAFEWNFGRRRPSHSGRSSMSGISPCCSRIPGIDYYEDMFPPTNQMETHVGFNNSLACEAPHEVSGEESDKDPNRRSSENFPRVAQIETVQ
ncbi:hypothetical protein F4809DRAFT_637856 [Biscogniauxia mediterranea]|nr:hypothetical protein F4809DRAFT_637856 [Biscogniauxia mediterranea]